MRKYLYTVAAFAAFIPQAHAQDSVVIKPYIGFDLQRSVYDYNDSYDLAGTGVLLDGNTLLEDSLNGANIHAGVRLHKNFGVELGYFRTKEESKDIAENTVIGTDGGADVLAAYDFPTKVKVSGFTLDGLGYVPVTEKLELIGTAGASWSKGEITIDGESESERELGFRLGGGAQFNFTDKISARGLVRYQTADFKDVADNAWTGTLGLNYSF